MYFTTVVKSISKQFTQSVNKKIIVPHYNKNFNRYFIE